MNTRDLTVTSLGPRRRWFVYTWCRTTLHSLQQVGRSADADSLGVVGCIPFTGARLNFSRHTAPNVPRVAGFSPKYGTLRRSVYRRRIGSGPTPKLLPLFLGCTRGGISFVALVGALDIICGITGYSLRDLWNRGSPSDFDKETVNTIVRRYERDLDDRIQTIALLKSAIERTRTQADRGDSYQFLSEVAD